MSGSEKGSWPWYTSEKPTLIGRAMEYFNQAKKKRKEQQSRFTIDDGDARDYDSGENVKVYDRDEELKSKLDWVEGMRKRA